MNLWSGISASFECRTGNVFGAYNWMTTKIIKLLDGNIQVGIDKGDMPDLTSAPSSLLDALQDHLNSLEGNGNFTTILP